MAPAVSTKLRVIVLFLVHTCMFTASLCQSAEELLQRLDTRMISMEKIVSQRLGSLEYRMSSMENRVISEVEMLRSDIKVLHKNQEKFHNGEDFRSEDLSGPDTDSEGLIENTTTITEEKQLVRRILALEKGFIIEKNIIRELEKGFIIEKNIIRELEKGFIIEKNIIRETRSAVQSVNDFIISTSTKLYEIKTTLDTKLDQVTDHVMEVCSKMEENITSSIKNTVDRSTTSLQMELTNMEEMTKVCDNISENVQETRSTVQSVNDFIIGASTQLGEIQLTLNSKIDHVTNHVMNECIRMEENITFTVESTVDRSMASLQMELTNVEELTQVYDNIGENVTSGMKLLSEIQTSVLSKQDSLEKQILSLTHMTMHLHNFTIGRGNSCQQLLNSGFANSGVYLINKPNSEKTFKGYCDMVTDGGGWLVFQRRQNGWTNFNRSWSEYRQGFGDVRDEFWLGNELLHEITSTTPQELRVDLWDWDGLQRYAQYGTFHIRSESTGYRLNISDYSGTAGDSLWYNHGRKFVTSDRDNSYKCHETTKGAWWHYACTQSNLNGPYHTGGNLSGLGFGYSEGMVWYDWKRWYYSLKKTEMKIRPK